MVRKKQRPRHAPARRRPPRFDDGTRDMRRLVGQSATLIVGTGMLSVAGSTLAAIRGP